MEEFPLNLTDVSALRQGTTDLVLVVIQILNFFGQLMFLNCNYKTDWDKHFRKLPILRVELYLSVRRDVFGCKACFNI